MADALAQYRHASQGLSADIFGKKIFPVAFLDSVAVDASLYVAVITPAIHYTMGGLAINSMAQVLRALDNSSCTSSTDCVPDNKDVIPRLYAAGEVSGGVHGASRLGGNSLLECVVFGQRAAESALTDINAPLYYRYDVTNPCTIGMTSLTPILHLYCH